MSKIKLKPGMKVRFDPYQEMHSAGCSYISVEMVGIITLVHVEHRYFMVEAEVDGKPYRVSYKFDDFYGPKKKVFIVKE